MEYSGRAAKKLIDYDLGFDSNCSITANGGLGSIDLVGITQMQNTTRINAGLYLDSLYDEIDGMDSSLCMVVDASTKQVGVRQFGQLESLSTREVILVQPPILMSTRTWEAFQGIYYPLNIFGVREAGQAKAMTDPFILSKSGPTTPGGTMILVTELLTKKIYVDVTLKYCNNVSTLAADFDALTAITNTPDLLTAYDTFNDNHPQIGITHTLPSVESSLLYKPAPTTNIYTNIEYLSPQDGSTMNVIEKYSKDWDPSL